MRAALVSFDRQLADQAREAEACSSYVTRKLLPAYSSAITQSAAITAQLTRFRATLPAHVAGAVDALQTQNARQMRIIAEFVRQLNVSTKADERLCAERQQTLRALHSATVNLERAMEQAKNNIELGLATSTPNMNTGIGLADPVLLDRIAKDVAAMSACETGVDACNAIMGSHSSLGDARTSQTHTECASACFIHRGPRPDFLSLTSAPTGYPAPARIKPWPKTRRPAKPKAPK